MGAMASILVHEAVCSGALCATVGAPEGPSDRHTELKSCLPESTGRVLSAVDAIVEAGGDHT